ncbi:MAG: hypothetical protein JWN06_3784 [Propionibacteriaceae bacterium]|jgi:urease accessory protein|nr:hypothetical protein [Propionibacteriaceae bacterium]
MTTVIQVHQAGGRHRCTVRAGLIRPQICYSGADRCRVALIATRALLLGGDAVAIQIELGAGSVLELFDVAGTVAYPGRGRSACWSVDVNIADSAALLWRGEPLVVSGGAEVERRLRVELGAGSTALVRDTTVLGRLNETGGQLRSRTDIRLQGQEILVEDQLLTRPQRELPGILGANRVIDTITSVGQGAAAVQRCATQLQLPSQAGSVTRYLGTEAAGSPLGAEWARLEHSFPV